MRFLLALLCIGSAGAACNVDDHHPENGGFFYEGVGGVSDTTNLDSAHGQKLPNSEWVPGKYYPYGESIVCDPETDRSCRPPCSEAPGCPQYLPSHTCSILQFCPPENSTEPIVIYEMPDFEATDSCDFSAATPLAVSRQIQSNDACLEVVFEEDHQLREYYFASREGCAEGQKVAVKIADFSLTADECIKIGLTTSRLRNCDCRLEKTDSTLGEPCRTAFSDSCQEFVNPIGDCCDTGTCISKLEDFSNPIGSQAEMDRRDACEDSVPGLCYNEDGLGTDTNRQGSINCCTATCSECGTEQSPYASWRPCTSYDPVTKKSNCGFLSRYDSDAFKCNFALCPEMSTWSLTGEAIKDFAGIEDPAPKPAPGPVVGGDDSAANNGRIAATSIAAVALLSLVI